MDGTSDRQHTDGSPGEVKLIEPSNGPPEFLTGRSPSGADICLSSDLEFRCGDIGVLLHE
jgi:hypothetical protein